MIKPMDNPLHNAVIATATRALCASVLLETAADFGQPEPAAIPI
jgi:hypothetical protein